MSDMSQYFRYLDRLREIGSINMHGAAAPLQKAFGLERVEANRVLDLWIATFDESKTAEERAWPPQGATQ
jgi:hypothetical protein